MTINKLTSTATNTDVGIVTWVIIVVYMGQYVVQGVIKLIQVGPRFVLGGTKVTSAAPEINTKTIKYSFISLISYIYMMK